MNDKTKIWIFTNVPSPYQVDFFNAINESPAFELTVVFLHDAPDYGGIGNMSVNFGYSILDERAQSGGIWKIYGAAIRAAISSDHDVYILSGFYTSLTYILCSYILSLRGKRWYNWLERPWPEDYRPAWSNRITSRSRLARSCRRATLKTLLRKATGTLCMGEAAVKVYSSIAGPGGVLHNLPYYCDVRRFMDVDDKEAAVIRSKYCVNKGILFMFSGQLITRKGVDLLLDAFEKNAVKHEDISLLFVGDGPLRAELAGNIKSELSARVHFAGMITQQELPLYYKAADVFVFPSRHDGWAVVINEACAAGLPVISTRSVGAAVELVRDGESGFLVARDDLSQLAERMEYFILNRNDVSRFGEQSRQRAEDYSPVCGVEKLKSILNEGEPEAVS